MLNIINIIFIPIIIFAYAFIGWLGCMIFYIGVIPLSVCIFTFYYYQNEDVDFNKKNINIIMCILLLLRLYLISLNFCFYLIFYKKNGVPFTIEVFKKHLIISIIYSISILTIYYFSSFILNYFINKITCIFYIFYIL